MVYNYPTSRHTNCSDQDQDLTEGSHVHYSIIQIIKLWKQPEHLDVDQKLPLREITVPCKWLENKHQFNFEKFVQIDISDIKMSSSKPSI